MSILCKYCGSMWLKFEPDTSGRLKPICVDTGQIHECKKSPWNLKKQRNAKAREFAKSEIAKIEKFEEESK